MHASVSGLAEYLVEDDAEAVIMAREVIDRLAWNDRCPRPNIVDFSPPVYDPDEIAGIVPIDYRKPYDVREVLARVVDGSDFSDFNPLRRVDRLRSSQSHGLRVRLHMQQRPDRPRGRNEGDAVHAAARSGQHADRLSAEHTGYMVGTEYERAGMIKHGSKMIQAVTNVEVPRLTFMIGASYGAGNYGMCGRAFNPDFLYTWPNASTGVMGGEQAAKVMSIVAEGAAKAAGREPDRATLEAQTAYLTKHFNDQSGGFYTSGHNMDDGMIDPRDTRKTLGFLLATVWESQRREVRRNSFGIARM